MTQGTQCALKSHPEREHDSLARSAGLPNGGFGYETQGALPLVNAECLTEGPPAVPQDLQGLSSTLSQQWFAFMWHLTPYNEPPMGVDQGC